MADELIPAQIRNGGTGSNPVPGAPDYRQLQSPEQIRTDLPDSGAGARAAALGSLFKEFEGISSDIHTKAATQAGALAGAASGDTGHPDYKAGFARFTAYGRAFNNAATGAYAVQAEAQADDAAARLRVQANNDPATFNTTYTAVRDAVLKIAPPDAVPMLTELYNKHLAAGMAAIAGDQATEQRNTQRAAYDEGVARQTSRVAILQGSDNPQDQLAAMDEHTKLSLLIDGGVNSGLYSKAEAQAMHIGSMRTITAQVFQTQFDKTLAGPDGAVGAVTLLEKFQQAHIKNLSNSSESPILSEPEYQKLYADGVTKLREYNLGIAALKRDGKTAEQMKFEEGDKVYTSALLEGKLTERSLDAAVRSGDLKPEVARTLRTALQPGNAPVKSDPKSYGEAINDPNFLDMSPTDFANLPGISVSDKLNLQREQQKRLASWENTQAVKDGKNDLAVRLKITPGTPMAALSETERRALMDAQQEYLTKLSTTDPAQRDGAAKGIAAEVVQHAQQREAASDVQDLMKLRESAVTHHGAGSADPWDDAKMKVYLKQKDDAIAAASARAKGQ